MGGGWSVDSHDLIRLVWSYDHVLPQGRQNWVPAAGGLGTPPGGPAGHAASLPLFGAGPTKLLGPCSPLRGIAALVDVWCGHSHPDRTLRAPTAGVCWAN